MYDMNKIGGPYGDCTSDYSVRVLSGTLVRDFCRNVASTGEHGSVSVGSWSAKPFVEFYNGVITIIDHEQFDRYSGAIVLSAVANGGWGMMNYVIRV
jgi:hypothetical protein